MAVDQLNAAALAYDPYARQTMTAFSEDFLIGRGGMSGRAGQSLVIRSSVLDEKAASGIEEDLNVMARILDKTLDQKSETAP